MKDFFSQFFSPLHHLSNHISQRFNNPLGLAFLFSWVVINWQALYYFLFNDGSAENKIKYLLMMYKVENVEKGDLGRFDRIIEWFKYTDNATSLEHLLWSPLLAAILYVIFSPLLSNIVTGVWCILDKSCTSIRLKFVQGHTILTTDEKKAMYQALSEYEKDSQAKIMELEELVESLKNSKQIELALKREAEEADKTKVDTAEKALKASSGAESADSDIIERVIADAERRAMAGAAERAEGADSDAVETAIADAERRAIADENKAVERAEAMAEGADSDAVEIAIADAERRAMADENKAIERAEAMAERANSDAVERAIADAERRAIADENKAIERAESTRATNTVVKSKNDQDAIETQVPEIDEDIYRNTKGVVQSLSDDTDLNDQFANTNIRKYIVLNDWLNTNVYDISNSKHKGQYKVEAIKYLNMFVVGGICVIDINSSNDMVTNAKRNVIRDFVTAGIIDYVKDNEYRISRKCENELDILMMSGNDHIKATVNDYAKKLESLEQLLLEKYNRTALGEWFTVRHRGKESIANVVLTHYASKELHEHLVKDLGLLVITSVLKAGETGAELLGKSIPLNELERNIVFSIYNHFIVEGYFISLSESLWMLSLKVLDEMLDFINDYNNGSDTHESEMIKGVVLNKTKDSDKELLLRASESKKLPYIEDLIYKLLVVGFPANSKYSNIDLYKKVLLGMVGTSISGNGYTFSRLYSKEDTLSLIELFSELEKNEVCFNKDDLYYLRDEIVDKVKSIIAKELDK